MTPKANRFEIPKKKSSEKQLVASSNKSLEEGGREVPVFTTCQQNVLALLKQLFQKLFCVNQHHSRLAAT